VSPDENYQTIQTNVADLLRRRGFRRAKNSFSRDFERVTQIVSLQKLSSSTPTSIRFRLNVGLWSLDVAESLGESTKRPRSVLHCHAHAGISVALRFEADYWVINDDEPCMGTMEFILEKLSKELVPNLDNTQTPVQLLRSWQKYSGLPTLQGVPERTYIPILLRATGQSSA
jgi:hypothetical protein